jgi:tetratricopeptide (TPR) repeat protein
LLLFPDNAPLHASYADLLSKTSQPESALKEFAKALEFDPKNSLALAGQAELQKSPTQK